MQLGEQGEQDEPHEQDSVAVGLMGTAQPGPHRGAGHLRAAIRRTNLLPAFLVLTVMMVALWLAGMPFLQALTISTAVKIALVLLELRRLPAPDPEV
ncbi:hypothetical protein ACIBEA_32365 [Streptomyces sp. NPDC051555]|uniref:hypothetical protein n=1 Tax=Streptomyces sp. NPDC051555 TaxID=3365657 RepID=UPI0037916F4C